MSREIRESITAHYNPFAGKLVGKQMRQAKWGLGKTYVKSRDGKRDIVLSSPFLGSKINPKNRNVYMQSQLEYFIERHTADVIRGRESILAQKEKTDDELIHEVAIYNMNQVNEETQYEMAERFARYQANKEQKHFKSWCNGKKHFIFHGEVFPVMTEDFIMKSKEAQEIKRVKDGAAAAAGTGESATGETTGSPDSVGDIPAVSEPPIDSNEN